MALDALSDAAGQLMEGLILKLQICFLRILKSWQTTWALHRCSYTTTNSAVAKIRFCTGCTVSCNHLCDQFAHPSWYWSHRGDDFRVERCSLWLLCEGKRLFWRVAHSKVQERKEICFLLLFPDMENVCPSKVSAAFLQGIFWVWLLSPWWYEIKLCGRNKGCFRVYLGFF